MESLYFGTTHARLYIFANYGAHLLDALLGIPVSCTVGKSMVIQRRALEALGGLDAFASYLAEDNIIGQRVADHGFRLVLAPEVATQRCLLKVKPGGLNLCPPTSLKDYALRRVRWARLRRSMSLLAAVTEPLTEGLVPSLLASSLLSRDPSLLPLALLGWEAYPPHVIFCLMFLFMYAGIWGGLDCLSYYAWSLDPQGISRDRSAARAPTRILSFYRMWLVREALSPLIFLYALASNVVDWRGQHFRLLRSSFAIPIPTAEGSPNNGLRSGPGSARAAGIGPDMVRVLRCDWAWRRLERLRRAVIDRLDSRPISLIMAAILRWTE